MASINELGFPAPWLLQYLYAELSKYTEMGMEQGAAFKPIFPIGAPTNTEELYTNLLGTFSTGEPIMIMWDRLMRFRPNPLYTHKREQLLLFIYTSEFQKLMGANIIISQALDREDAAAQDVNKWLIENHEALEAADPDLGKLNIFFRNFKVYQADETRDVVELASARTLYVNKLIIEYDYHVVERDGNVFYS